MPQWYKIHEAKNPAALFRHFHSLDKARGAGKRVQRAVGVIAAFKAGPETEAESAEKIPEKLLADGSATDKAADDDDSDSDDDAGDGNNVEGVSSEDEDEDEDEESPASAAAAATSAAPDSADAAGGK